MIKFQSIYAPNEAPSPVLPWWHSLVKLLRLCLWTSVIPSCWQYSYIQPMLNNGDCLNPWNELGIYNTILSLPLSSDLVAYLKTPPEMGRKSHEPKTAVMCLLARRAWIRIVDSARHFPLAPTPPCAPRTEHICHVPLMSSYYFHHKALLIFYSY